MLGVHVGTVVSQNIESGFSSWLSELGHRSETVSCSFNRAAIILQTHALIWLLVLRFWFDSTPSALPLLDYRIWIYKDQQIIGCIPRQLDFILVTFGTLGRLKFYGPNLKFQSQTKHSTFWESTNKQSIKMSETVKLFHSQNSATNLMRCNAAQQWHPYSVRPSDVSDTERAAGFSLKDN